MYVRDLLGIVFADHFRSNTGSDKTAGIAQRQVDAFQQTKASACIGEAAHADVRQPVHYAFIALWCLSQCTGRIDGDFDLSIAGFPDLLGPGLGSLTLDMCGREKDT